MWLPMSAHIVSSSTHDLPINSLLTLSHSLEILPHISTLRVQSLVGFSTFPLMFPSDLFDLLFDCNSEAKVYSQIYTKGTIGFSSKESFDWILWLQGFSYVWIVLSSRNYSIKSSPWLNHLIQKKALLSLHLFYGF